MGKLRRFVSSFFRKPILFDDFTSIEPVSRTFGLDRGIPIDRYYIESFLKENSRFIQGNVLEIAENTYSKRFGSNITSYEILHYDDSNKKATIIGDLTKPETLPENKIDCFICTQTLNFIFDVQKAIEGSNKLLKQGGCFLGTVSGISQISRYDMDRWGDYWRFTDLSVLLLMESVFGKGNVDIVTFGNSLAATAFLKGLAIDDIPNAEILDVKDKDYQVTIGIRAIKKVK
jgi:hypothetical protein